jgi:hypothetical protein
MILVAPRSGGTSARGFDECVFLHRRSAGRVFHFPGTLRLVLTG